MSSYIFLYLFTPPNHLLPHRPSLCSRMPEFQATWNLGTSFSCHLLTSCPTFSSRTPPVIWVSIKWQSPWRGFLWSANSEEHPLSFSATFHCISLYGNYLALVSLICPAHWLLLVPHSPIKKQILLSVWLAGLNRALWNVPSPEQASRYLFHKRILKQLSPIYVTPGSWEILTLSNSDNILLPLLSIFLLNKR